MVVDSPSVTGANEMAKIQFGGVGREIQEGELQPGEGGGVKGRVVEGEHDVEEWRAAQISQWREGLDGVLPGRSWCA